LIQLIFFHECVLKSKQDLAGFSIDDILKRRELDYNNCPPAEGPILRNSRIMFDYLDLSQKEVEDTIRSLINHGTKEDKTKAYVDSQYSKALGGINNPEIGKLEQIKEEIPPLITPIKISGETRYTITSHQEFVKAIRLCWFIQGNVSSVILLIWKYRAPRQEETDWMKRFKPERDVELIQNRAYKSRKNFDNLPRLKQEGCKLAIFDEIEIFRNMLNEQIKEFNEIYLAKLEKSYGIFLDPLFKSVYPESLIAEISKPKIASRRRKSKINALDNPFEVMRREIMLRKIENKDRL
jgi:hypothetical protein